MLRRQKKVLRILFAVVSLIRVLLTEPSVDTDKSDLESEDPENEVGFHTSVLFFFFHCKILSNGLLDIQATIHHSFRKKKGGQTQASPVKPHG
jgi:hypothetical protein